MGRGCKAHFLFVCVASLRFAIAKPSVVRLEVSVVLSLHNHPMCPRVSCEPSQPLTNAGSRLQTQSSVRGGDVHIRVYCIVRRPHSPHLPIPVLLRTSQFAHGMPLRSAPRHWGLRTRHHLHRARARSLHVRRVPGAHRPSICMGAPLQKRTFLFSLRVGLQ